MHFTTAILTTLSLVLSARADQAICFPLPGKPNTIPQNILDLDVQTKLDWAADLCAQMVYPSPIDQGNGLQVLLTPLASGIAGDDGKIYGLEIALHAIQNEDDCNSNADFMLGSPSCLGGGLLTLSSPLEQWSYITALN
ncbi:hypothetical protein ACQKWADRAFT_285182 [Trichoderma austrokoningii]